MSELLGTSERIESRPIVLQVATRPHQRQLDQAERLALLMRDAQDGDRAAYASLLKEILPILKRRVQSRLGFLPIMDREDIVQEILLSLHAARATYDPKRPFMPWLMSIAQNRMIDSARRNSRRLNKRCWSMNSRLIWPMIMPASQRANASVRSRCGMLLQAYPQASERPSNLQSSAKCR